MTKRLICTAVLAAWAVTVAGTANADPDDPSPGPGYVIQAPGGPVVGGLRSMPPICGAQPRACAGNWNPDTGTWDFPGT
jgi:hypothetical protein